MTIIPADNNLLNTKDSSGDKVFIVFFFKNGSIDQHITKIITKIILIDFILI